MKFDREKIGQKTAEELKDEEEARKNKKIFEDARAVRAGENPKVFDSTEEGGNEGEKSPEEVKKTTEQAGYRLEAFESLLENYRSKGLNNMNEAVRNSVITKIEKVELNLSNINSEDAKKIKEKLKTIKSELLDSILKEEAA